MPALCWMTIIIFSLTAVVPTSALAAAAGGHGEHGEHAHVLPSPKARPVVVRSSAINAPQSAHMGTFGHVALTIGAIGANNVLVSGSWEEGTKQTFKSLKTPEFLLGTVLGGLVGAHLGAMVPLAGLLGATGLMGSFFTVLPAVALASIFARVSSEAISQARQGDFSFAEVIKSIDWFSMGAQIFGATLGAALGSCFMGIPVLASIALGVLGAYVFGLVAENIRGGSHSKSAKDEPVVIAMNAHSSDSLGHSSSESRDVHSLKELVDEAYARLTSCRDQLSMAKAMENYRSLKEEFLRLKAKIAAH